MEAYFGGLALFWRGGVPFPDDVAVLHRRSGSGRKRSRQRGERRLKPPKLSGRRRKLPRMPQTALPLSTRKTSLSVCF